MVRSNIALTEGSGAKKTDTWQRTIGGTDVQQQVVLLGEPIEKTYSLIADSVSTTTANDHILQLMAGASNNVRIHRIRVKQFVNATTVVAAKFQLFRVTSAGTGGGAVTPSPFDVADGASGATGMTLPSSKGTEGAQLDEFDLVMRQAYLATAAQKDDLFEWVAHDRGKPYVIAAGTTNGIVLKCVTAVASATVIATFEFTETSYL